MKFAPLALAIALSSGTAIAKSNTHRIVGGEDAKVGDWPFMTALVVKGRDNYNGQFCGASYIGGRYVLTATHCVEGSSAADFDAVIGIRDLSETEGTKIAVNNIYMHEDYNTVASGTVYNDMAILELAEVPEGLTEIKLATAEIMAKIAVGDELTAIGWGNTVGDAEEDPSYPHILQQVNLPLVDEDACSESVSDYDKDVMLCAGLAEGGKDTCQGDSGGPLLAKVEDEWYQVGVVSFGEGCAQANKFGVYAEVSQYPDWIAAKTSGVSFTQDTDEGYREQGYAYDQQFTISNFSDTNLSVLGLTLDADESLAATISENTCTTTPVLTPNQSCSYRVKASLNNIGDAEFSVTLRTTHADAAFAESTIKAKVLGPADDALATALDQSGLAVYTTKASKWNVGDTETTTGSSSINSGDTLDNESSVIMIIAEGNALSFDYKVSSEEDYDFFKTYHNDALTLIESGVQTEFSTHNLTLAEGKNRIVFSFERDGSVGDGQDKVWLDKVTIDGKFDEPVAETPTPTPTPTVTPTKVETKKKSSGGVTYFLLTLLPLLFWRRK